MSEVVMLKLASGMDVIGTYVRETKAEVVLDKPLLLIIEAAVGEGEYKTQLVEMYPFAQDPEVSINKAQALSVYAPTPEVAEAYLARFEGPTDD